MVSQKVGVLGFQGCISPHLSILQKLGVQPIIITSEESLQDVERLILPGGESTTMLNLLERSGMFESLRQYVQAHPVWGICAGAILLAQEVYSPTQKSLGAIQIRVTRNYYGSQTESFETPLEFLGGKHPAQFIRAPLLEPLHSTVEVLARWDTQTVLLQEKSVLVSSFHTELSSDFSLHEYFLSLQ